MYTRPKCFNFVSHPIQYWIFNMTTAEINAVLNADKDELAVANELEVSVHQLRKMLSIQLLITAPTKFRELVGAKPIKVAK
jgi:two-component SAPR family response regulator